MNERIEHCLYQAGLTAQGCWDELDDYAKEGIEKFAELIIRETLQVARAGIEYGPSMEEAVLTYFDLESKETFKYSEEYDSYYSESRNEWTEDKCSDPECNYCTNRPDRPLP
jgi:hypothetical protein